MKKVILIGILIILAGYACKRSIGEEIDYPAAYVVNGEDHSISVINLATNQVTHTFVLKGFDYPHHISLSPDKLRLAVSAPGIDLSGGHSHAGHGDNVKAKIVTLSALDLHKLECDKNRLASHNAAFSPSGSEIWAAYMDTKGQVLVYDAKKLKEKAAIHVASTPLEVTFSADGTTAFVCCSGADQVIAIDAATRAIRATISVGSVPVGAWPASNNKMYVDNEMSKTISVIDVATLAVEDTISLGFTPAMVAYNQSVNELYITDPDAGLLHYYTYSGNWTEAGTIATGAGAHGVAVSNDGSRAYVTNQGAHTVTVIDLVGKTKLADIAVGKKPNGIVLRYL